MAQDQSELFRQLIALQKHYRHILEHHEIELNYAREQLTHINALLADQFVLSQGQSPPLQTIAQPKSKTPLPQSKPVQLPKDSSPTPLPLSAQTEQPTITALPQTITTPPTQIAALSQTITTSPTPEIPTPDIAKGDLTDNQPLSKIDTVAQVMAARANEILHVDEIIQHLYGELSSDELRAERARIRNTMLRGVKQGRWFKALNQEASYTLDPNLISVRSSGKTTRVESSKKTPRKSAQGK